MKGIGLFRRDFTTSKGNRLDFETRKNQLEDAAQQLGLKSMDDWYKVKVSDLLRLIGPNLLNQYNRSIRKLLIGIYPNYDWKAWRFHAVPKGFWKEPQNVRECIEWLGRQLNVKQLDDWYNIKTQDLETAGGAGLLKKFGYSISSILQICYPGTPFIFPFETREPISD
jgi:hypothetical protein